MRISAKATIIATGGLTRLYRRNSASTNMGGDGYALALRAGASLIDMEFVQFFPIGHLAPRLIGMDPIMWDPFRYKLGGRLLNRDNDEFTSRYGTAEDGKYILARDLATYAITKEVEAGRGSPHGGVYLSFEHRSEAELRSAFGPVIDRLAANGIDLTKTPVEVAPIAHYHMGGIVADVTMATEVPGLFAAGEAVGGANGANRLSGNAITEAFVFGRQAGRSAAARANRLKAAAPVNGSARAIVDLFAMDGDGDTQHRRDDPEAAGHHGRRCRPFPRRGAAHARAVDHRRADARARRRVPQAARGAFDMQRLDWLDLRNMLPVARSVAQAALARTESRGAHQREDHAVTRHEWQVNQEVRWRNGELSLARTQMRSGGAAGMTSAATLKVWRGTDPSAGRWEIIHGAVRPGTVRAGWPALHPHPRTIRRSPFASPASMPTPARNA